MRDKRKYGGPGTSVLTAGAFETIIGLKDTRELPFVSVVAATQGQISSILDSICIANVNSEFEQKAGEVAAALSARKILPEQYVQGTLAIELDKLL